MFEIKIIIFSKKIFLLKFYFASIISVRSTLLREKGRIRSRIRIRIRTCDQRIRMRIREARKHTDPDADPEPEHWV
jgi:hypothetical protein